MSDTSQSNKRLDWQIRASKKSAIVPEYFEVFPNRVEIICGNCKCQFRRSLIVNIDEPTFVCPECGEKNWIPLRYDLK